MQRRQQDLHLLIGIYIYTYNAMYWVYRKKHNEGTDNFIIFIFSLRNPGSKYQKKILEGHCSAEFSSKAL